MEQESELVSLGKIIHENSYKRENRDFALDNIINVDFIRKGDVLEIHEVKKSTKMEKAHLFQLLYYLYYLKHEKGISNTRGFLDYPKIRKKEEYELNPTNEAQLEEVFDKIKDIIDGDLPKPVKKPFCRKCAYFELCWV
jgi:CRISPR-associated exonuclease Cas4